MMVQIGKRELEMGGKYMTELRDSNDIFGDIAALRQRLEEDGYLLLRGFHERERIMRARGDFVRKLRQLGRLDEAYPLEEAVIADNKGGMWGSGAEQLKADFPNFLDVVNGPEVLDFFGRLLGGPAITYDYKWPRAVGHGGNTGAHYDIVYMGRGTPNVYTMWTPYGDVPLEMGTLALCLGSQHFEKMKETYGRLDVDRDNVAKGWFSEDPIEIVETFGGRWATTDFAAGDCIIFGMFLMHASLNNTTNRFRISSDTRYQLASEPVDERWIGVRPKGHYAWNKTAPKPMEDARKEWGI